MKKLLFFPFLALIGLAFTSCEPDDPEVPEEPELITKVLYTLTDTAGDEFQYIFEDTDGDGGVAPVVTNVALKANSTYTGSIQLFNGDEEITSEIEEEDEDHQFFFEVDTDGVSISYNDMDADGNPIGLISNVTTTDVATGNLVLTLKHKPVKDASGVKDGDIANSGGETDIEVVFDLNVE